jgi:ABC-type branched-subunit amino acid transport system ATPase component
MFDAAPHQISRLEIACVPEDRVIFLCSTVRANPVVAARAGQAAIEPGRWSECFPPFHGSRND